jgi:putative ABC transport system permease protein
MNGRLLPEVRALTRDDLGRRERQFWLKVKPVGIMFSSGVAIAFIAGAVILYQVLANEVQHRLNEYATLKALGYGERAITGFVLQQGLLFAILGFAPAFFLAIALYAVLRAQAQVPVAMTGGRALLVLLLTLAMGICAGLLAVGKLRRADPAELF